MQFTKLCWLTGNLATMAMTAPRKQLHFSMTLQLNGAQIFQPRRTLAYPVSMRWLQVQQDEGNLHVDGSHCSQKSINGGDCRAHNSTVTTWKGESRILHPNQSQKLAGSCYYQNNTYTSHSPSLLLRNLLRASPTTGNFPSECVLHWSRRHKILFQTLPQL